MIVASASLAIDQGCIAKESLRAFIMLVTFLTAAFTPDFLGGVEVIVYGQLILLVFISLLDNSLDHFNTFREVFIVVSSNKDVKRLILIYLFSVISTTLYTKKVRTKDESLPYFESPDL